MRRATRDVWVSVSVILGCAFIILVLLLATGCSSCDPCPDIKVPTVVEVPIPIPPSPIPTPRPPSLSLQSMPPADTVSFIEAISNDWHELVRAYKEAIAIITAHNTAINESE